MSFKLHHGESKAIQVQAFTVSGSLNF